jgi:protein-tyrosine phosphatase
MSAVMINLQRTEDRRDVVHRAVQSLSEGQLVLFPTETVYVAVASGRSVAGTSRLKSIWEGERETTTAEAGITTSRRPILAIRSFEDVLDYVPALQRFAMATGPGGGSNGYRRARPGESETPRQEAPGESSSRAVTHGPPEGPPEGSPAEGSLAGCACGVGLRMARRCWPGPVCLVYEYDRNESLAQQLPAVTRQWLTADSLLGLWVSAHLVLRDVLRMIAGPLVLIEIEAAKDAAAAVASPWGRQAALALDDGPCRYGQPLTIVRVGEAGYQVLVQGVVPESAMKKMASMMIVVVCTGNTCRSPMAEGLLRRMLAQRLGCADDQVEERGVAVASAGISAAAGAPASAEAVRVMQSKGVDISRHASQPLSEKLVRDADLVLTLTSGHRQAIVARWPELAQRVKTLRPDEGDVDDPIGAPAAVYEACAQQIEAALRDRLSELQL